ncbi:hypothetical protein GCM10023238_03620 [Streptomyces heliomycini]
MPYLGAGSVGIGMVLDDYLAHREDEEFARARGEIVAAAQAMFYAQPGLYRGVAGMVLYLGRTTADVPGTDARAVGVSSTRCPGTPCPTATGSPSPVSR